MRKLLIVLALASAVGASAQSRNWEVGIGGAAMQFNRLRITDLAASAEGSSFNLKMRHVVWGGNLYVARSLSRAFAVDFQGVVGSAESALVAQAGLGLQWRLGGYFGSSAIDPYFRVGGNYLYKGFDIYYSDSESGLAWQMANNLNKEGRDSRNMVALAVGAGTNMWLNRHLGIGLQADYIFVPRPSVANSLRGIARVMWRFGGANASDVERRPVLERHSEPPTGGVEPASQASLARVDTVFIRDTIYIKVPAESESVEHLARDIEFEFDSATLTAESRTIVERIAAAMSGESTKYLITGTTDARGNAAYNERLSLARANAVRELLVEKGVATERLKAVGLGLRAAHAPASAPDNTRHPDRRVTFTPITNPDYWQVL